VILDLLRFIKILKLLKFKLKRIDQVRYTMETQKNLNSNLTTKNAKEYDVIIVGLGCFGLGAAYYL
jgi:ribulose 1,5-bisphosphate synthetase/thiazole synthase